jgi:hypothetical protein
MQQKILHRLPQLTRSVTVALLLAVASPAMAQEVPAQAPPQPATQRPRAPQAGAPQPPSDFRTWYGQRPAAKVVPAQTEVPPQPGPGGASFTAVPPAAPVLPANPYAVEYKGRLGGYLSGGADVIGAQGQFMKDQQEAYLTKEQVSQSRMETRRKKLDEVNYERANTPSVEEEREFSRALQAQRSRRDPPPTEIWSSRALNSLLTDIQLKHTPGPTIPLESDTLRQINFTAGTPGTSGGVGLLKNGGNLEWPALLEDDAAFADDRQTISELAREVSAGAQRGEIDSRKVRKMGQSVEHMMNALKGRVRGVDLNDYIAAKKYLGELQGCVAQLRSPNASKQFDGSWEARASTVAQLVGDMTKKGLKFAPSVTGQEAAYTSLHRSLADYNTAQE